MQEFRLGLLGAGRIGLLHAELVATRVDGIRVVAVHDPREGATEQFANRSGLDVAADVDHLLEHDLDAVAICTSTDSHAALVARAAEAGVHVFCEKPLSNDLVDLDHAIAAVEAAGVQLHVGFNRRFDPSHRAVRDHVAAGDIGRPYVVRITSRDPEPPELDYLERSGGIFMDMTIHDFDMARFLVGQEVAEVYATGSALVDGRIAELGDVDTAVTTLRYDSGALAVIDNSRLAVYGYDQRVEVHGSSGVVRSENLRPTATVLETGTGAHLPAAQRFFLERYLESYVQQWRAFVAALRGDAPPEVGGREARAPVVLALAAQRSLETGRPVVIDEVAGAAATDAASTRQTPAR